MDRGVWAAALMLLGGLILVSGCSNQQLRRNVPVRRVAGTEERVQQPPAHQVTFTITKSGVRANPETIPPGSLRVRVINSAGNPEVLTIKGPGFQRSTRSLRSGQSQTFIVQNAKPGTYTASTGVKPGGPSKQTKLTVGKPPAQPQAPPPSQPSGPPPSAPSMGMVNVTVTNSGVQATPSQVSPGNVQFTVTNNGYQVAMVTVQGPGGVQKTTSPLQPGQSDVFTIPNLQQGKYTVTAMMQGQQPSGQMRTQLTVAPTPAGQGGPPMSTVSVVITPGKVTLSPSTVPSGQVMLNIQNNGNSPRMVTISGPGDVSQTSSPIPAGSSGMLLVQSTSKGSYTVTAFEPGRVSPSPESAKLTVVSSSRVAGSQEKISTVNMSILSTGVQLSPQQVPPGIVILSILNNTYAVHMVTVKSPAGATQATMSVRPGVNAKLELLNMQPGTYMISAPEMGKQPTPAEQTQLMVTPQAVVPGQTGQVTTVMVDIMSDRLSIQPGQVSGGPVQLRITNDSTELRTVKIQGPGVRRQSKLLQPTEKETMMLANVQPGSYTITAPAPGGVMTSNWQGTLVITGAAGQRPSSTPPPPPPPSGGM